MNLLHNKYFIVFFTFNTVWNTVCNPCLNLLFRPDNPKVSARISAWMKEHHLQLNLAKTELLVFPATPTLQHEFTIQLGSSTITPSSSVRNLGVIFDDQLTFKDHIVKTARSCRFALHNIRKIRPYLTEHAAQLLIQALVFSRLDYCNALLAGLTFTFTFRFSHLADTFIQSDLQLGST